jgi:glycosyltransferase involved in cell wall biosynthesis
MAARCPVLISDAPDLAADIWTAGAGMACPPTVDDFAFGLRVLMADAALREPLGANGSRMVSEWYVWEPIAKLIICKYLEAAAAARANSTAPLGT